MKRPQRKKLNRAASKRRKRFLASLAAAGVAGSGSLAQADITTTLTGVPGSVNNASIPADHGSTAETTLAWPAGDIWDQYTEWDGRGDVYQINERLANIMFTPASPNIRATVNSFEFDEWAGGGDTSAMWSVMGSTSGLLASGNWTNKNTANDPADMGGRTLISPNATGAPGEKLTLAFDHSASGGLISYLAIDNLTFSSRVIPEPTSAIVAWLGVGGLGALAMRRQRR
jgi:MYXO-CTERM domain-containing protein